MRAGKEFKASWGVLLLGNPQPHHYSINIDLSLQAARRLAFLLYVTEREWSDDIDGEIRKVEEKLREPTSGFDQLDSPDPPDTGS